MMAIEDTLFTRLSTFAGLTALVGARIYPLIIPEGQGKKGPCVTYQRISTEPRESCMVADDGYARARIQVTAWGDTYTAVKAVAEQVRQALQRWSATGVLDTFLLAENDLYDEEALKFGAAIDAQVVYTETV